MSEIEEVTMESVRWPIAPDGYIPNSTIRSWSRGGRSLGVVKGWDDVCFPEDYSSDEDTSGRVFWLDSSDDEEEEITFRVKRRRKEEDDGKDRGEGDTTDEMGGDDEKETELEEKKDEMRRRFSQKRPRDLQTTTHRNHEVGKMRQEAGPTYCSRTLENVLPTSSQGNRPEPREDVKVPEVVTSPPRYRPEPRGTTSFIPEEPPEPLVQRPVATTERFIPKPSYCRQQEPVQELPRPPARDTRIKKTAKPRFTAGPPTAEPQDWTPQDQDQESEPSTPEDPQPQPDPDPPEDKRFLLSAPKYDNMVDRDYASLDSKVLRVYKDRNMSRRGKLSRPPNAPKVIRYTAGVRLVDGLRNAKSSTVQTRPNRVRHPNGGRRRLLRPDSEQSVQTFTYSEDQMDLEPEPELTSLQGFCPASVKPSNVEQLVASMTAVQLGQVPAPQPVVQSIGMKETQTLSPAHFHYLILLASQRNVFTLDLCGETPHGNMQVDWMALTCCS